MSPAGTLAARAGLGAVAAVSSLLLVSRKGLFRLPQRTFDRGLMAAYLGTRAGLFVLVFLVLRIPPRGDIPAFYWPEALQALQGHLPYRDYLSSYAPLHGFLDAAVLRLWPSPLALIAFAMAVEAAMLPVLLRLARYLVPENEVRVGALLYLASPVTLQFVAVDGQDNVLIAGLLAGAVLLLYRRRPVLSGACLAAAVVLVKFLALLFFPVLLLASAGQWRRWLAGFGGILVAGYAPFALLHLPLLYPLQMESQAVTASNLPYLLESLTGAALPFRIKDLILAAALSGICLVVWRAAHGATEAVRGRIAWFGCSAVVLALLLLSKKSWPPYLVLIWFSLCVVTAKTGIRARTGRIRPAAALFVAFAWVAILTHSVWATTFQQAPPPEIHNRLAAWQPSAFMFIVLQASLLAGYMWLLLGSLREAGLELPFRWSNPGPFPVVRTVER